MFLGIDDKKTVELKHLGIYLQSKAGSLHTQGADWFYHANFGGGTQGFA